MNIGRITGRNASVSEDARARRRMLEEDRLAAEKQQGDSLQRVFREASRQNVIGESAKMAEAVRAGRVNAQDKQTQVKQLRYSYKAVSAQILRSKTSAAAKQAVGKAMREVVRLKRLRQSGEYDEEELQSAILHAQAMERAAKKKAAHLQQEEMIEACSDEDSPAAVPEEEKNASVDSDGQNEAEQEDVIREPERQEMNRQQMEELVIQMAEKYQINAGKEELQMLTESMDELWSSMQELLEETGFEDLAESTFGGTVRKMAPEDLKLLKLKHRTAELKEMTKADCEYLKAQFERLAQKNPVHAPALSMPDMGTALPAFSAGSAGISVDISL